METFNPTQLITVYGPLGIGWVVAFYLFGRLLKLTDNMQTALIAYTEAITRLTTVIQERLK